MATSSAVFDTKTSDFKDAFGLLESQEKDVLESIKTLISENLESTRESWLINNLVDYFYSTKSTRVIGILCSVHDPHDKFLLDKLHDGIKSKEDQLSALQLLLHIVCKQPSFTNKMVQMPVLKVVIKCLKSETNIPVLMTGVCIVTILLPSVPYLIGPYLPDIFESFHRLASFTVKKPVGSTPDIFLLHLQIAVYSLFHRLYGMYPYNFLSYLRHFYTKKENSAVFEEVIKNMLEHVRLHPKLVTGNKEHETSSLRWKQMETHDVIVECARMSLDPVEGTWEELKCPIAASRYMVGRSFTNQDKALPPVTSTAQAVGETSPVIQPNENVFWSPSEVIGLSTPPPSQRNTPAITSLEIPSSAQSSQSSANIPTIVHNIVTPSNTPRETPPISDEHEKGASRTSSRNPKRLSAEFPIQVSVPLLTPSSATQSVPPSPLKTEFTSTPPVGVKTLPVLYAARELQFDREQHIKEEVVDSSGKIIEDNQKPSSKCLPKKVTEKTDHKDVSKIPSRSSSATRIDEQLTSSVDSQQERVETAAKGSVSVDNLSQVIEDLEANDDDSDEEVSALTADHMITAESVAKFMKNVNRIRFNSLSTSKSVNLSANFGSKRSRSCPQLPKIEPMTEEEEVVSRSASTTMNNQETLSSNLEENMKIDKGDKKVKENLCDISISSTGSTVTVNTKQETKISVETTTTSTISVAKCPVYSNSSTTNNGRSGSSEENQFTELFKQLLNPIAVSTCQSCVNRQRSSTEPDPVKRPYFTAFSPPELLDQHIKMGGEIHAKELSKLPIPSTQNVNWTHFGGAPPADEISILRGQLMLLHNQLLYERNKREQHARRNRRLLRKIANAKILEGQNKAMDDQIKQHEMMIRDLNVSLKLLQDDNRKLTSVKESQEYEKLVQLKTCLQENESLKTTRRDQSELLEKQREEQEALKKKLMTSEARLFTAEKELETMRNHASMNVKLKEQVFQLQKEVTLMGELLQKNLNNRVSKYPKLELEKMQKALKAELQDLRSQLEVKTKLSERYKVQIEDKNKHLENKEITISEFKLNLQKVKSSHNAELKSVEDKHQAVLRINQTLESQILQLNTELEELRSKLHSREKSSVGHTKTDTADTSSGSFGANSDSLQKETGQKSPLSRMASSTSDQFENSETILAHLQAESEFSISGTVTRGASNLESSYHDIEVTERQAHSETASMSSRESGTFHGHVLSCTDTDDNQSVSAKSSNFGDSGFS